MQAMLTIEIEMGQVSLRTGEGLQVQEIHCFGPRGYCVLHPLTTLVGEKKVGN